MNTAVINIKVEPKVKKEAQEIARDMGISLSALVHGLLKNVIKTKTVTFSTKDAIPSEYMIKALKESKKDIKAGRVSPAFDNVENSIKWLEDPNARYQNGDRV